MSKVLTEYSTHATLIAETFRAAFAQTRIGDLSVEMTAPEGSTKGGLLALQHVTLKPVEGLALVVGSVHSGERRADLRTYEHVANVHAERFKRPMPCDAATYQAFLDRARTVLAGLGLSVTIADPAPAPTPPIVPEDLHQEVERGSRPLVWISVLLVSVGLAALAVWLMMRP